jgi:hypothetical protein
MVGPHLCHCRSEYWHLLDLMLTHAGPNLARPGVNLDRSGAGCAGAGGHVVACRGDCRALPEVSFAWLKGWLRAFRFVLRHPPEQMNSRQLDCRGSLSCRSPEEARFCDQEAERQRQTVNEEGWQKDGWQKDEVRVRIFCHPCFCHPKSDIPEQADDSAGGRCGPHVSVSSMHYLARLTSTIRTSSTGPSIQKQTRHRLNLAR